MVCIYCRSKTKTSNSRAIRHAHQVWRRRVCTSCGAIFTTRESVDLAEALRVQTAENALEPFVRDKLLISLHASLSHRKSALKDAAWLSETIISKLIPLIKNGVVTSASISACAAETLEKFDDPSAVHFRAHHTREDRR